MIKPLGRGVAILAATVLVGGLPAMTSARASTADPGPTDATPLVLARAGHGAAAITSLGDRLDRTAALNHLSAARLRTLLRTDGTAWVSPSGRLFYREPQPAVAVRSDADVPATATGIDPAQAFTLHSDPTATHTLYLDFTGASLTGTAWNTQQSLPAGSWTGFDLDGDPGSFTTAERATIAEVWREVAQIYAPFDIDVTTQDPGDAALLRSSASDDAYGVQVLITSAAGPGTALCGACSGLAWVSTFDMVDPKGLYRYAWAFADTLGENPMLIAQTTAHEAGHTFGLHHDGDSGGPYAQGNGNWHPIMGYTINRPISQFSKGEYAGANNTEDDLAIIAAHGAPLRADTVGDTIATASPLTGTTDGLINSRADSDVYSLPTGCTAPVTIAATGGGHGSPLDLRLSLLDGTGAVLATADPPSGWAAGGFASGLDASLTATLHGPSYLRVEGVGAGNPLTTDRQAIGYSDYGSIGDYRLGLTGCTGTPAAIAQPARPGTPRITSVRRGLHDRPLTIGVSWAPGTGKATRWQLRIGVLGKHARITRWLSRAAAAGHRTASYTLPDGRYVVEVRAVDRTGASRWSAPSRQVRPR